MYGAPSQLVCMMPDSPLNWLDIDLFDFDRASPRFEAAGEHDGTWTVMDQLTKLPAVWDDKMLFGLTFEQADDMVDSMNQILMAIDRA